MRPTTRRKTFGFVRVAAVSPACKVAGVEYNHEEIKRMASLACLQGAQLIVMPELCITGYSIRDLVNQDLLLRKAQESLEELLIWSHELNAVLVVGLPMEIDGMLVNITAVIDRGYLLGLVPKSYLPESGEFEEGRWYRPGHDLLSSEIQIMGKTIPVGVNMLFKSKTLKGATFAIETCEDAWVTIPPGAFHALAGATIIVNPSASNELVGKAEYRRDLVRMHSATRICGYIYASCGPGESTTDVVFGGHCLIAENNIVLQESELFQKDGTFILADFDTQKLMHDRMVSKSFGENTRVVKGIPYRKIAVTLESCLPENLLLRPINIHPFTSEKPEKQKEICEIVFSIQVHGLIKRLEHSGLKKVVLGLSGGKDSLLAYLVCIKAFKALNWPLSDIHAISMPGPGTSKETRDLAKQLGSATSFEEIDITEATMLTLKNIGHDGKTQDVTYENAQAGNRTLTLFRKGNQIGALVIGTGDLSEIANGFCTFGADHLSTYNVNCGVPKGLVKYVLGYAAHTFEGPTSMRTAIAGVLNLVDSPELTHSTPGTISQVTEDKVGPYELAEFFLYEFVRWGSEPQKILYLAEMGFGQYYKPEFIKKWLISFYKRFFGNQWKRSVATDGPQVGSISLSPRGKWRMPSDAEVSMWLAELED
ncbi:MAG: NAD(+) synthase [Patescibacteria group bacterium]|mgnify:CR=1 FL=1